MSQLDSTPTLKHSLLSLIGTNIVDSHCNVNDSIGQSDADCRDHVGDENDAYLNNVIFP